MNLRVVTMNPWALFGAWTERRKVLIDGLRELRPDLVSLVEVVRTEEYDQALDLIGPDYHLVHQTSRGDNGAGVSIASRWPIRKLHEVDLHVTPRTGDFPCATLVAELDVPKPVGPTAFVATNPNWQQPFEHERQLQALSSARFVEDLVAEREMHVVLAGDFDATPEADSMRFWRGLQSRDGLSVCYRDSWEQAHPGEPGHTFTKVNPLVANGETAWDVGRRIDYILVRCNEFGPTLEVASCERIFDQPVDGVWASDHYGLVADLQAPSAMGGG